MDDSFLPEHYLQTFKINLQNDCDLKLSNECIEKVLKIYEKVLSMEAQDSKKRLNQIDKRLQEAKSSDQKYAIQWLKSRCCKYNGMPIIPSPKIQKVDLDFCPSQDNLRPSLFKDTAGQTRQFCKYDAVSSDNISFFLNNKGYMRLCLRRSDQEKPRDTIWRYAKTVDQRFVWRAKYMVDFKDVMALLFFILQKREKDEEQCPSIVINAGSHGGLQGQNAHQGGNLNHSDHQIYNQMKAAVMAFIDMDENGLAQQIGFRLNRKNLKAKVFIHLITSNTGCIYPQSADHIIDVQCRGAYTKVKNSVLYPKKSMLRHIGMKNPKLQVKDLHFITEQQLKPKPLQQAKKMEQIKKPQQVKKPEQTKKSQQKVENKMKNQTPKNNNFNPLITQSAFQGNTMMIKCPSCQDQLYRVNSSDTTRCNVCRDKIFANNLSFQCRDCDFDVCGSCSKDEIMQKYRMDKKERQQIQCPCCGQEMDWQVLLFNIQCNQCYDSFRPTTKMLFCHQCNQTMCKECYQRGKNNKTKSNTSNFLINQKPIVCSPFSLRANNQNKSNQKFAKLMMMMSLGRGNPF